MTTSICYVNGTFTRLDEAALPVQDLAILRGYGVFDFLRTYHGRPFRLLAHLERLENSARLIGLALPESLPTIATIVEETLRRNELSEANIRIVVTGGIAQDGITPAAQASLIVLVTPAKIYPLDFYSKGVKIITVEAERYLPGAKTINYIPAMLALQEAKKQKAVEALYVNQAGHILEGTTTNFYIFQGDTLLTPKDGILFGVTRDIVLELGRNHNFSLEERALTFADLEQADEVFITASNKEMMPVSQVNEIVIGTGRPGANTQQLMASFRELVWAK